MPLIILQFKDKHATKLQSYVNFITRQLSFAGETTIQPQFAFPVSKLRIC